MLKRFTDWMRLKGINEMANYGFENSSNLGPVGGTRDVKGEDPYHPLNTEEIIDELVRQKPLGIYKPRSQPDIVEWGEHVGAMRVEFSPLGSYKAFVRRKIKDLKGENTWICKHIWPLQNESKHMDKEVPVAHEMYEHLEKLSMTLIDSPKKDFPEFDRLANKLISAVRMNYPSYCMFPAGMKKVNEDYYKVYFEFRGHGQQSPKDHGRVEQFDIDLFWDRKKGLIRCWGYNIESAKSQHSWIIQPSEFDEWFAPSQEPEEIIECVKKIFMGY